MSSMTSRSNSCCMDNYSCCSGDKRSCHRKHRSEQGDALLRANTGSFGPANIPITTALLNPMVNQPITSVTIDTDQLDEPTILVQFLGTLTTIATAALGLTFNFTLFRNCQGGGYREQLRSFSVSHAIAIANIPDSRGLSFAFTQSDLCFENCCTYTLELTSVNATVAVGLNITINGTLSVLAVGEEEE